MKTKPEMIILMGLPACGKNTWIKKNKKNYVVVELDWIRREILGHQYHQNAEFLVVGMAKSIARMLCSQDKNVIINSTGLVYFIRNEWVSLAREYGYRTKIVFLDTHWKKCYARNNKRVGDKVPDEVMKRMELMLQPPTTSCDKVDKVIIIEG